MRDSYFSSLVSMMAAFIILCFSLHFYSQTVTNWDSVLEQGAYRDYESLSARAKGKPVTYRHPEVAAATASTTTGSAAQGINRGTATTSQTTKRQPHAGGDTSPTNFATVLTSTTTNTETQASKTLNIHGYPTMAPSLFQEADHQEVHSEISDQDAALQKEEAGVMPGMTDPFVDTSSCQRCDVVLAYTGSEDTSVYNSTVISHNVGGIVTVTLIAKTYDGKNRTYGGDTFRCQLRNIVPDVVEETEYRSFAYSYDHCNGTYTCQFDMRYAPPGEYAVRIAHLLDKYLHEARTLMSPACGATVGSVYLPPEKFMAIGARYGVGEIEFNNTPARVSVGNPARLDLQALPQCTLSSPSTGRWISPQSCTTPDSTCRVGDQRYHVKDTAVWAPLECSLRYINPDDFARKAKEANETKILVLGDSRSRNVFHSLVQFFSGYTPDPATGIIDSINHTGLPLAKELPINMTKWGRTQHASRPETYSALGINITYYNSYGTQPFSNRFPCPEHRSLDEQKWYINAQNLVKGTWFENFILFFSLPQQYHPDVLIFQDGGLHDMFNSVSESQYIHNVKIIIKLIRNYFKGKRAIYVTLPAAYVRNQFQMKAECSAYNQWRRVHIGKRLFSVAGFDVWDIHQMTATRADRYFDAVHFHFNLDGARPWNVVPNLLAHEIVQDLANRMYMWP